MEVRRLHRLLSARAFVRSALYSLSLASVYIDDRALLEEIREMRGRLEEILHRLESEIGEMIYGPASFEEDRRVYELIRRVVEGPSSETHRA